MRDDTFFDSGLIIQGHARFLLLTYNMMLAFLMAGILPDTIRITMREWHHSKAVE